jgi:hypothetical protein
MTRRPMVVSGGESREGVGASVPDQALAVPVEPASGLAPPGFDPSRIIDIAVAIAAELGDDFDAAPYSKAEWIKARGGDPFRDVSLPFQCDYLAAASVALRLATGGAGPKDNAHDESAQ